MKEINWNTYILSENMLEVKLSYSDHKWKWKNKRYWSGLLFSRY